MKQRHEYGRHPIDFALCRLSFFQAFQLHFHEGPHIAGFGFEYATAPSNVSRDAESHCNTYVIADFMGITEVLEPERKRAR